MTFFKNRVVPPKPPSFVKLARKPSGVTAGSGNSTPTRDQVPLEIYAKVSLSAGTATTAEAVSWEDLAHAEGLHCVGQVFRLVPSVERSALFGVGDDGANDEEGCWHRISSCCLGRA